MQEPVHYRTLVDWERVLCFKSANFVFNIYIYIQILWIFILSVKNGLNRMAI